MIAEFEKEKVFWTRKMNLKLVHFMQSKPHIWNPKHSKYTSVRLRDKTYAEFALQYGNKFSGQAVKERWTNIRSTFASYLRKLKASSASGTKYKVNWHLWEPCHFLLQVSRNINPETCKIVGISDTEGAVKSEVDSSETPTEDPNSSDASEPSVNNTKEANIDCQAVAQNLLTVFKTVQNDPFGLDNSRNSKIGRLVAKKLSRMDSYDAAVVSHKITEVLLRYNEYNPANPNT